MKRLLTFFVIGLPLSLFAIFGTLFATNSGSAWLLTTLAQSLPLAVSFGEINGSLYRDLVVKNVRISNSEFKLGLAEVSLNARWGDLRQRRLTIERSKITGVEVVLTLAESDAAMTFALPSLTLPELPVGIDIYELTIDDIHVADGQQSFAIENVLVAGSYADARISVRQLNVLESGHTLAVTGTATERSQRFPDLNLVL